MRSISRLIFAVLATLLLPGFALAQNQSAINGTVRDSSGAVLPGVTVEAASPVLIEKVRTAITDGGGQYHIEDLRPGTYSLTFTLTGFSTVKREGIELTGSFTATVNADMKVGAVAETIVVTGETPVVDVVNAKQLQTVSGETLEAIPTARLYHSIATLVPGVSVSGSQDVGGLAGPVTVTFNMRGGPGNEGRLTLDGLSLGASLNGTGVSYTVADVPNAQEITFTTAGGLGELEVGGPAMNLVPRQGGNKFTGSFFGNWANDSLQTSNYTDAIRAAGLSAPNLMQKIWDSDGAIGGPIRTDKLWFFATARYQGNRKLVAGMFDNANAGDPTKWTYVPSTSQSRDDGTWKSFNARLTWQASQRNKFSFYEDQQWLCTSCMGGGSATTAPEARGNNHATPTVQQVTWSSPYTSKLLLEAGFGTNIIDGYGTQFNLPNASALIPVVEACTGGCAANGGIAGLSYRGNNSYVADSDVLSWRASITRVTGGNTAKIGYYGQFVRNHFPNSVVNDTWTSYRFNNGVPLQLTQLAGPALVNTHLKTHALFAQDQLTLHKLTISAAVRYDRSASFFPEEQVGPNPFILTPTVFPAQDGTSYNDITPRAGIAYDVFGNGKTSVKVNFGKYLAAADGSSITGALTNPLSRISTSVTRTWTDQNRNFRPDCDLSNPLAQDQRPSGGDFCGQISDLNFAKPVFSNTFDPAILHGWGIRPYDWNFGLQVQQEVAPRVSVNIGYFRRWFGNFFATDNLAVTAADYSSFSITAPADSRLPGGGGNVIGGLYDVSPALFGRTNNFITKADNFGSETQHWNSVEINLTARVRQGLTFQGGTSTGRLTTNVCEIRAQLPELTITGITGPTNPYCNVVPPFLTQFKGLASYNVPKIDVQVSGTMQSIPGANLAANLSVPTATTALTLGRPLAGNAPFATVNLVNPGDIQGDRINQLDLRVGKVLHFGRSRVQVSVDLYNALNSSAIQSYNQTFITNGSWLTPTLILPSRFAKITGQVDF
ncbi:MAG TPA: TonB-dependent receptor [Vicinamibacterales bacterium]|nr:TonB-dependent receptor [Vicinamibacterales bacterium]